MLIYDLMYIKPTKYNKVSHSCLVGIIGNNMETYGNNMVFYLGL